MNIITTIFVWFIKILFILSILAGLGFFGLYMLMAMICGGGGSIVIFLPMFIIAIIIGIALIKLSIAIGTKPNGPVSAKNNEPPLSNSLKALDNFVVESYKHGTSREDITEALIRNGWNKQEIDDSFNRSFHGSN